MHLVFIKWINIYHQLYMNICAKGSIVSFGGILFAKATVHSECSTDLSVISFSLWTLKWTDRTKFSNTAYSCTWQEFNANRSNYGDYGKKLNRRFKALCSEYKFHIALPNTTLFWGIMRFPGGGINKVCWRDQWKAAEIFFLPASTECNFPVRGRQIALCFSTLCVCVCVHALVLAYVSGARPHRDAAATI